MPYRIGKYTLALEKPPIILSCASVGSKKEGEGPLKDCFDYMEQDSYFGQNTWEKAESRIQREAVNRALAKGELDPSDIDYVFAGDLLNQCTSSVYGLRELGIPLFGLYGACSTMAESLSLASIFVDSGAGGKCVAVTSSHFCSAERQFRFPLEYAGQRTPTSQWTVTGGGAAVIGRGEAPPFIRAITTGTVEDYGIKDANNMGAAMAPAASATICRFFKDTGLQPDQFDMIVTGDLGYVGSGILLELTEKEGIDIHRQHQDCGLLIFDREKQPEVQAGGSGCGCSGSVLCGHILPQIQKGSLKNVLFIATGALMSTTSVQQGDTIPGIAHLVYLSFNMEDIKFTNPEKNCCVHGGRKGGA
jgi:stage V sporulation protein AD